MLVGGYVRILYSLVQSSITMNKMCDAIVLDVGTTFVNIRSFLIEYEFITAYFGHVQTSSQDNWPKEISEDAHRLQF